jgi:hypothetical protein
MAVLLLACVAMAAALTVIGQPPATPGAAAIAPTPEAPSRTAFVVPTYDRPLTPEEHAQVMLGILLASIPPAYTLPDSPVVMRMIDGRVEPVEVQFTRVEEIPGATLYTASTEAYLTGPYGVGAGTISISALVGSAAMPVVHDLCSVAGPPQPDTDIQCRIFTTDSGVRVRYASTFGWRYVSAAVAYPGLTVFAVQTPSETARWGLDQPILNPQPLAELVASPALKPVLSTVD